MSTAVATAVAVATATATAAGDFFAVCISSCTKIDIPFLKDPSQFTDYCPDNSSIKLAYVVFLESLYQSKVTVRMGLVSLP